MLEAGWTRAELNRSGPRFSRLGKEPVKGYYASEGKLVERIKAHVAPGFGDQFRTIECHIMDVADDIA
jgi:dGTPase